MRKSVAVMCLAILGMAGAASAQVRTVTGVVTDGSVTTEIGSGGALTMHYDLSGEGFRAAGMVAEFGVVNADVCASGIPDCDSGVTLDFGTFLIGSVFGSGLVTVNGETLDPAFFSGAFKFESGTVTIPKGNRKRLVLSAPFTFGATEPSFLEAFATMLDRTMPPPEGAWARLQLSGSGTATGFFERLRVQPYGFFYRLRRIVYNFEAP